jgi:hypothetical protein
LKHATNFYKSLFGHSERGVVWTGFDFPRMVNYDDNDDLVEVFSYEEIKKIVFSLTHNKSPGPDGFPSEFYQGTFE